MPDSPPRTAPRVNPVQTGTRARDYVNLTFSDSWINCYEVIDNWPDADCGDHALYPGRISGTNWRWNSSTLYGNFLVNPKPYYAAFNTDFAPGGYSVRTLPPLETARFKCYGSTADPCKF
ncbi:hypothetical protein [Micromonospora aurantiaca (nom. illeg.)]|uniref:hypothetical protein n=1 Tax=Micromonospora aurantiaca (nom. illeg.) TaxID=47850 RepID=UPI0033ECEB67